MRINCIGINNNYLKQSFKSNNKNINPNHDDLEIVHGTNYDMLDSFELKRDKSIVELKEALKNGEDISQDRDKLIYSRMKKVISDAKEFSDKHPQFNYDDICQELLLIAIKATDAELRSDSEKPLYPSYYEKIKNYFFNKIITQKENNGDAEKIYAIMSKNDRLSPDEIIIKQEDIKEVLKWIDRLPHREKTTVELRFGLKDGKCWTFKEIGKIFHIVPERARQIEKYAIRFTQTRFGVNRTIFVYKDDI